MEQANKSKEFKPFTVVASPGHNRRAAALPLIRRYTKGAKLSKQNG